MGTYETQLALESTARDYVTRTNGGQTDEDPDGDTARALQGLAILHAAVEADRAREGDEGEDCCECVDEDEDEDQLVTLDALCKVLGPRRAIIADGDGRCDVDSVAPRKPTADEQALADVLLTLHATGRLLRTAALDTAADDLFMSIGSLESVLSRVMPAADRWRTYEASCKRGGR